VKDAFSKLKPGTVRIICGTSSVVLSGNVKRLDIRAQGYCTCRELYNTTARIGKAALPLKLGDKLEYDITKNKSIRLIAIH